MRSEGGQATVEWVGLILLAALVLGAAAALSGRTKDHGLGDAVARRIAEAPGVLERAGREGPPPAASTPAMGATPPPVSTPRAVQAFRRLRGIEEVAKRAWIVCLGYRRWRYELENPMAPNQALPLTEALSIVNGCLNPYDYLVED